jgi:laminin, alpha 3/5
VSVHGNKTFFIGEMVDGSVNFSVDSGDRPRSVTLIPESGSSFCDGQWHTCEFNFSPICYTHESFLSPPVTFIKSRFIISLNVDKFSTEPNVGNPEKHTQIDTTRPLFLGGHPHIEKVRGFKSRHNYQGCIRSFKINDVEEKITSSMLNGDVQAGNC